MVDDPSLARRLVDAIISDYPDHKADTRPVHTIGVGVKGHFIASPIAGNYTTASHFQGDEIPVTVRFSNGTGSPVERDSASDVRGMATRFHLPDGSDTDLIAMTLGEFFTRSTDEFLELTRSAQPQPVQAEGWWRKMIDMLSFRLPLAAQPTGDGGSGAAGLMHYAERHQFAQRGILQAASIGAPVSYVRASYHAVHTFVVIDKHGVRRYVRFTWQPVAGVRNIDESRGNKYLHQELRDRLAKWPARFILRMTIGDIGDALDDPTEPWPTQRIKVVMGTLYLTHVAQDQQADCEKLGFNPCRLTPGIEVSSDPILHARRGAYQESQNMRGATACPFHNEAS